MKPSGEYEAQVNGALDYQKWKEACIPGLLYQRRRGGGTFVVIHGR